MSTLLDSLSAGFRGNTVQRETLAAVLRDGLPHARVEAWKYTPLRALERRSFASAEAVAVEASLLDAIGSPRIVFVNGHFDSGLSALEALPAGVSLQPLSRLLRGDDARATSFLERRYGRSDEPFARLNAAMAGEGAVLRIEAGTQATVPLHFVFIGAASGTDAAWHVRHLVELGREASASLIEHHLASGEHANLGNMLTHVHLGADACLQHARIQAESAKATLFARTDAVLARDARYNRTDLELGAALSRHELNVRLEGQGAHLVANGVLFADGRRHVDTRLGIEHIARDTSCDLLWRGLAGGRGKSVFHGGITIRAGADGSDANLSNKNLLLSADAEIDTQPVLVIHADEVKAAHGATVGQLDPTALFYLRSRGLDEADARRLLTAAFCREVVTAIEETDIRGVLAAALDRALLRLEGT